LLYTTFQSLADESRAAISRYTNGYEGRVRQFLIQSFKLITVFTKYRLHGH
jgi:hypothetical protein